MLLIDALSTFNLFDITYCYHFLSLVLFILVPSIFQLKNINQMYRVYNSIYRVTTIVLKLLIIRLFFIDCSNIEYICGFCWLVFSHELSNIFAVYVKGYTINYRRIIYTLLHTCLLIQLHYYGSILTLIFILHVYYCDIINDALLYFRFNLRKIIIISSAARLSSNIATVIMMCAINGFNSSETILPIVIILTRIIDIMIRSKERTINLISSLTRLPGKIINGIDVAIDHFILAILIILNPIVDFLIMIKI